MEDMNTYVKVLDQHPTLVLNADFRPLSKHPLSLWNWQKTVTDVIKQNIEVVEEYPLIIHGGNSVTGKFEMFLPSVVALKSYQKDKKVALTRRSLAARDKFRCAYCSEVVTLKNLTFDHLVPRSKGGKTVWENIVLACQPCNRLKANKTLRELGWALKAKPYIPTRMQLNGLDIHLPSFRLMHPSWATYLDLSEEQMNEIAKVNKEHSINQVFPDNMTSEDYWTAELED
jgi:5-methylcytosine-specific restriction endonuclease McrA